MSRDPYQDELMVLLPRSSGGRSAYAYAVEGGYTGTEKEFAERLASLLSRPVVGSVDGGDIVLTGDLAPGTYTFAYVVRKADGTTETVPIGTYTAEESAPKTYTIKWCNYDGTILETDTVIEGETPVYKGATPTRVAEDQYTYRFIGWDKEIKAATADVTYTATFNLSIPEKWTDNTRLSSSTVGKTETNTGQHIVNSIPCVAGDTLYIKGMILTELVNSKDCVICTYDENGNALNTAIWTKAASTSTTQGAKDYLIAVKGDDGEDTDVVSYVVMKRGKDGANGATAKTAYVRFCGALMSGYEKADVVITVNQPIE